MTNNTNEMTETTECEWTGIGAPECATCEADAVGVGADGLLTCGCASCWPVERRLRYAIGAGMDAPVTSDDEVLF